MAFYIGDNQLVTDNNLGAVGVTVIQSEQGAIQIDGVLRLNRDLYLRGAGLLECLALEDRYLAGFADIVTTGTTYQDALGYPAVNFINPDEIVFP